MSIIPLATPNGERIINIDKLGKKLFIQLLCKIIHKMKRATGEYLTINTIANNYILANSETGKVSWFKDLWTKPNTHNLYVLVNFYNNFVRKQISLINNAIEIDNMTFTNYNHSGRCWFNIEPTMYASDTHQIYLVPSVYHKYIMPVYNMSQIPITISKLLVQSSTWPEEKFLIQQKLMISDLYTTTLNVKTRRQGWRKNWLSVKSGHMLEYLWQKIVVYPCNIAGYK